MEHVALVFRLLIAATFCVAGIAKLFDQQGTRKGIRDFGLPERVEGSLGLFLPLAELAVAVMLVPLSTVLWGSLGAIALLLVFIGGISVNLALGRKPACNCFGQLHSTPIGWPTLFRNCVLVCGAGFVLWEQRHGSSVSVLVWMTGFSSVQKVGILLGAIGIGVIAAQCWLSFHLLRQNGRLLLRMDALETQMGSRSMASLPIDAGAGLPIGSSAPTFELPLLTGGSTVTIDTLLAERRPLVMIFSDPDCGPCSLLLPDIARWQQEYAATLSIALISRGSQEANRIKIGGHRLKFVLLQKDREIAAVYQVNGTPSAVLVGLDGKIASLLAMGSQAIATLVALGARAMSTASMEASGKNGAASTLPTIPAELKIGHPAPSLRLPDLSGNTVDLSSFIGRDTLVLFWNPRCGFCAEMLSDLKRWEADRPTEEPHLLVVSSGTVEANRAMGLRSLVVLDQEFASGLAFRVRGTPSAILVDAEGKIASGVASGASAVFALAKAHRRYSLDKSDGLLQMQV